MKIFQCSDSFLPIVDGVGRVVKAYAETLAKRDNEVYVVTPTDNTGYRGRLGYEIVDFTSFRLPKDMPWKLGVEVLDSHFSERIKSIDGEIVHAHTPGPSGFVGKTIARKKHIPLVGSFHSKYYDDVLKVTHSKVAAKLATNLVVDFYKQCDEVWVVSGNAGETLREYGYKGKVVIMPNGTDIRAVNQSLIDPVAQRYGINRNNPIFLFVGQLNWKKNIMRILEGCARLKQDGYAFQLVLAGKGPDQVKIEKTAKRLGLENNIIFTGHLEDTAVLDCLYTMADLFVFPSIYDNAPMVLREAACMRTPSLVVKDSASAEVVTDLSNGLVCEDTTQDFCQTIENFLKMKKTARNKLGQNAFETIPIAWDGPLMDTILERYANLIEKCKSRK